MMPTILVSPYPRTYASESYLTFSGTTQTENKPLTTVCFFPEILDEMEPKEEDKWTDLGLTELSEM